MTNLVNNSLPQKPRPGWLNRLTNLSTTVLVTSPYARDLFANLSENPNVNNFFRKNLKQLTPKVVPLALLNSGATLSFNYLYLKKTSHE